jgi:hypothetical protein
LSAPEKKDYTAVGILLLLALIWGTSFILIKLGLKAFAPDQVGSIRVTAAFLFLLQPRATLDGVRMASIPMRYDSSKAIKELGFPQTPLRTGAAEAVEWFRTHGHETTGRHV